MIKKICKKKGFTLIELLVVIAIVAMLSLMAVNGYTTYRKSALIDLNADNLISQISELRYKSLYRDDDGAKLAEIKGVLGSDVGDLPADEDEILAAPVSSKCYGVSFKKNGNSYEVKSFQQDFENKKEFDSGDNTWKYKGCGNFPVDDVGLGEPLVLDELVNISELSLADSALGNFALRFRPPEGVMEIYPNLGSGDQSTLRISLQYGDQTDSAFQKLVELDLLNANFIKKNVEDTL